MPQVRPGMDACHIARALLDFAGLRLHLHPPALNTGLVERNTLFSTLSMEATVILFLSSLCSHSFCDEIHFDRMENRVAETRADTDICSGSFLVIIEI